MANHRSEADLLREVFANLKAGRWTEAHDLVQQVDATAAAWLHGIVHMQEGDLEDAEYWYDRAGRDFRQRRSLAEEIAAFDAGLRSWPAVRWRPLRAGSRAATLGQQVVSATPTAA